nr:hypothetical protein [uncultured Ligilactobacillus sp.]
MKNWFKHYISPRIGIITTIFLGIISITQFIDWGGIKIPHTFVLIVIGILFLLSIIADIYVDRLILKKKIKELKKNNDGLKENLDNLKKDKSILLDNNNLQTMIINLLTGYISPQNIKEVHTRIKLMEEVYKIGKRNQNSKDN